MKPQFRKCVGCGYCCMKAPCSASVRLYPSAKVCPQLIWNKDKNRYLCGLMCLPGNIGYEYRKELYADAGCCSGLNDWRNDVKERNPETTEPTFPNIPTMFQAFLKAYGSEPFLTNDGNILLLHRFLHELEILKFSKEEATYIIKNVTHYISSNRSSKFKGFI